MKNSPLFSGSLFRLSLCALVVFIAMGMLNPGRFVTLRNVLSMSYQFPELGIFSLAIALSLISGGIDLSIISVANLSAILAAVILTHHFPGIAPAGGESIRIGMAVLLLGATGAGCGLLNGFLIAYAGIAPILATLGTMQLFLGASFVLTQGHAIANYSDAFLFLGNGTLAAIPIPLVLFLVLLAVCHGILMKTRFGVYMQLIGTNATAAYFSGINLRWILMKTYILTGLLSSAAGLIVMSRANSAKADYGSSYLLQAVLVAILAGIDPRGGFGNVWGLLLAILTLQFLSSGLNLLMFHDFLGDYINNFTKELTWGVLLLLVMVSNRITEIRNARRYKIFYKS